MANSGPKTNGSQFFITHLPTPHLDGKHTVFGHVISGQDVVNAIKQDDTINKITIVRKGNDAKKFDAAKVFSDYMKNKADDEKREIELKRKAEEEKAAKLAPVIDAKVNYLNEIRTVATETETGLKYKIIKNGNGIKPADGANVLIHYAGYLEDGNLFDTSYQEIAREYGVFNEQRALQNGYQPFPFKYGNKTGLIPVSLKR